MKCRLMIGIAWMLWSLQTHADQNVTGSWHGVVDGHDVEVAFVMDGSGSQVGYLYAPADDCFSSVGVQIEKVLNDAGNFDIYDALFIDDVRPYQPGKSCDQAAGFSGFGRFTLSYQESDLVQSSGQRDFESVEENVRARHANPAYPGIEPGSVSFKRRQSRRY